MILKWVVRFAAAAGVLYAIAFGVGVWGGSTGMLRPSFYEANVPGGELPSIESAEAGGFSGRTKDPLRDFGYPFEEIEIPGEGGSVLRGWYVPPSENADRRTTDAGIVAVHGAGADRRQFLAALPVFHEAGLPVVMFDCREHGTSDGTGRGISYGIREHEDVRAAVAWAKETLGWSRVGVLGSSQGAASAILAAAEDANIDALVAENPFADIHDVMRATVSGISGDPPPADWIVDLVTSLALWRAGGFGEPAPIEVVDRIAPRPLFLLHGTADDVVPVEQSKRLYEQAGPTAELWIAPGAGHSAILDRYPKEFRERVLGFFDRTLRPDP